MDNQKFLVYLDKVHYNDFGCVLAFSYFFKNHIISYDLLQTFWVGSG